jgi:large subunit ribosomal protein L30
MAKIAIVRVKGLFGVKPAVKTTLASLRLHRLNHCVVFEDSPSLRGMIQVAKDYICWGAVKDETLRAVTEKRGNLLDKKRELESTSQNVKSDAKGEKGKAESKKPEKKTNNMLFALHAPRGGWNGTIKKRFPHGAAGPRDDIDALLIAMS